MKTLCIVPCGKAKIWDKYPDAGSTKAKDVYTGPYARKCQEYARNFYPKTWRILSAKYGFLKPDDIISGTYNVSFKDKKTKPIGTEKLLAQSKRGRLNSYARIIVLGGRYYTRVIEKVFKSKTIEMPLSGCAGIGHMMKRLNELISAGQPF